MANPAAQYLGAGLAVNYADPVDEATRKVMAHYGRAYTVVKKEMAAAAEAAKAQGKTGPAALRYERTRKSLIVVMGQLHKAAAASQGEITGGIPDLVKATKKSAEAYFATSGHAFNQPPEQALQAIIARTYGDVASSYKALTVDAHTKIKDGLIRAISAGDSPLDAARRAVKETEGAFGGGLGRAVVITRTELLDATRQANRVIYQANDEVVIGWRWLAKLDARTCAACWGMHNSIHPLEETLQGHQQCRCTPVPILVDEDPQDSSVGDPEVAFKALTEDEQRQVLGPTRHMLWADGVVPLREMAALRTSEHWRDSWGVAKIEDLTKPTGYVDAEVWPKAPPEPDPDLVAQHVGALEEYGAEYLDFLVKQKATKWKEGGVDDLSASAAIKEWQVLKIKAAAEAKEQAEAQVQAQAAEAAAKAVSDKIKANAAAQKEIKKAYPAASKKMIGTLAKKAVDPTGLTKADSNKIEAFVLYGYDFGLQPWPPPGGTSINPLKGLKQSADINQGGQPGVPDDAWQIDPNIYAMIEDIAAGSTLDPSEFKVWKKYQKNTMQFAKGMDDMVALFLEGKVVKGPYKPPGAMQPVQTWPSNPPTPTPAPVQVPAPAHVPHSSGGTVSSNAYTPSADSLTDSPYGSTKFPSGPARFHRTDQEATTWANSRMPDPTKLTGRASVTAYTGQAYTPINTYLRTGRGDKPTQIKGLDQAMDRSPAPEDFYVHRGTSKREFSGLPPGVTFGPGMVGSVYQAKSYLSTSIGSGAAFGGEVKLTIRVAQGTKAVWAMPISRFQGEREVVLDRGLKYKIVGYNFLNNKHYVDVEVLPPHLQSRPDL